MPQLPVDNAGSPTASEDYKIRAEQIARQLARRKHEPGSKVDEDDISLDAALRWRRALLRLSETFLDAAEERHDLSPILLGALHNALEQLLIHGNEYDLMVLEDWLLEGEPRDLPPTGTGDVLLNSPTEYSGHEKRDSGERRESDRRLQQRRS